MSGLFDSATRVGERASGLVGARCDGGAWGVVRRALLPALLVVLCLGGMGAEARADVLRAEVVQLNRLVDSWQERVAAPRIEELAVEHPGDPGVRFVHAKLRFHQHRYEESLAMFDALISDGMPPYLMRQVDELREIVANTIEATAGHEVYLTRNGLFEISHDPQRDALLLPWAEETLEGAWYEIGYDLGHWPEPPIRVEFYGRASVLGRVSSLTEEAVRTTSTIALCKYNKLMMTSPRGTLRGYGWRTTLAHEYVHYVVGQLTGDRVPVWLHEALAKLLEQRWTGERTFTLDPSQQSLLSRRMGEGNLVEFNDMHPSMALLPSQEDAATAYAQVFKVALYMLERQGAGVLRDLMNAVNRHTDVREAIGEVMGSSFQRFIGDWEAWLAEQELVELPGDFTEEIELRDAARGETPDERRFAGVEEPRARDHLRLGEMLRAREMTEAARVSYEKAEGLLGRHHPELQNALARTQLDMGDWAEALDALEEVAGWFPSFYRTHLHRAEALNRLERYAEARAAVERAMGINPFDPAVHREYAQALEGLGEVERAREAREVASSLR